MVEKKSEKVIKGLIKGVISGDYITIARTLKEQGAIEANYNLASV
jgi:hypothetical protein